MGTAAEARPLLKPFAKVMLALAYEREKTARRAEATARRNYRDEFPKNSVFARELAL